MDSGGERDSGLAPVIPLFGGSASTKPPTQRSTPPRAVASQAPLPAWNDTWAADLDDDPDEDAFDDEDGLNDYASMERELAEKNLLRKLRTRSLSIREARVLVSERDLTVQDVEDILETFVRRGYLDDKTLAEQLVHSAVDRKGQGRQVISQALAKRGIPRDVADAVIAELPDDDADRALEFARTKARSMSSLDRDTALRRLAGQLSRRGYGGSTAFSAARTALDEVARPPASRVSFRDS
jgi:regulatory protein